MKKPIDRQIAEIKSLLDPKEMQRLIKVGETITRERAGWVWKKPAKNNGTHPTRA